MKNQGRGRDIVVFAPGSRLFPLPPRGKRGAEPYILRRSRRRRAPAPDPLPGEGRWRHRRIRGRLLPPARRERPSAGKPIPGKNPARTPSAFPVAAVPGGWKGCLRYTIFPQNPRPPRFRRCAGIHSWLRFLPSFRKRRLHRARCSQNHYSARNLRCQCNSLQSQPKCAPNGTGCSRAVLQRPCAAFTSSC